MNCSAKSYPSGRYKVKFSQKRNTLGHKKPNMNSVIGVGFVA